MDERPHRNGERPEPELRRAERPDAPAYLRRYLERRDGSAGNGRHPTPTGGAAADDAGYGDGDDAPLYLRRYRDRNGNGRAPAELVPGVPGEPEPDWTSAWAATTKSAELVLPPELAPARSGSQPVVDVHFLRHGETQGYSVNAGLTPMGRWQAHRRGHDLSKGLRAGSSMLIACAPTPRAQETARQIRRGVEQGLLLWGREAAVEGPRSMEEFRNFTVRTPSGEMDVTAAFREYHAVGERYERVALGDRPLWLVEIDRFFRIQQGGGDAIHYWMTVPLLSFEPPTAAVLRFWAGVTALVGEVPDGGSVVVATHSGPIRALATWALGHDAGEPYNTEEVRVRVRRDLSEAQVTYRNRTALVHVPPPSEWPSWMRAEIPVAVQSAAE